MSIHMFLPELYALQHPNFFKFHAPTFSLARTLFLYLLPLSGTHFLTAFGSVNLCQLSGNTLKLLISNRHSLAPPSDPPPQHLRFNFWFLALYKFISLLTYLHSHICASSSTVPLLSDVSPSVTQPVSVLAWLRSRRASIHANSVSFALQKRSALTTESFSFTWDKCQKVTPNKITHHTKWNIDVK